MRPLALLAPLHLLGYAMAMAIGDPSAIEAHNASTTDIQSLSMDPIDRVNGPYCLQQKNVGLRHGWDVRLPGYQDRHDLNDACNELWQALSSKIACVVSSPHGCGPKAANKTILHWEFMTSLFCNHAHVEDAVAVGSRFKHGNVRCVDWTPDAI